MSIIVTLKSASVGLVTYLVTPEAWSDAGSVPTNLFLWGIRADLGTNVRDHADSSSSGDVLRLVAKGNWRVQELLQNDRIAQ